jgi:hypothetical protein
LPELQLIREDVLREVSGAAREMLKTADQSWLASFRAIVKKYLEDYFDTNVYTLNRDQMDDWLLPSVLAFPRLVSDAAG